MCRSGTSLGQLLWASAELPPTRVKPEGGSEPSVCRDDLWAPPSLRSFQPFSHQLQSPGFNPVRPNLPRFQRLWPGSLSGSGSTCERGMTISCGDQSDNQPVNHFTPIRNQQNRSGFGFLRWWREKPAVPFSSTFLTRVKIEMRGPEVRICSYFERILGVNEFLLMFRWNLK